MSSVAFPTNSPKKLAYHLVIPQISPDWDDLGGVSGLAGNNGGGFFLFCLAIDALLVDDTTK